MKILKAVLIAFEVRSGGTGFHSFSFRVDGGRNGMASVRVMISQDAHRKLLAQFARARLQPLDKPVLLKAWARWELDQRAEEQGSLPATVTITASDIDDSGAYASDLGRNLRAG